MADDEVLRNEDESVKDEAKESKPAEGKAVEAPKTDTGVTVRDAFGPFGVFAGDPFFRGFGNALDLFRTPFVGFPAMPDVLRGLSSKRADDGSVEYSFNLAGLSKDQVKVGFDPATPWRGETLTVTGDDGKGTSYSYSTTVANGVDAKRAEARFENGRLVVTVPKAEKPEAEGRRFLDIK